MNKIQLTQSQINAYKNGANTFMFLINLLELGNEMMEYFCQDNYSLTLTDWFISKSPIQKGDKDIFVQEEFFYMDDELYYNGDFTTRGQEQHKLDYDVNISKMTKEQSRYTFKECIDVRVIRIQDVNMECHKIAPILSTSHIGYNWNDRKSFFNQQMKEQNINYKDNSYIFLVEFKR